MKLVKEKLFELSDEELRKAKAELDKMNVSGGEGTPLSPVTTYDIQKISRQIKTQELEKPVIIFTKDIDTFMSENKTYTLFVIIADNVTKGFSISADIPEVLYYLTQQYQLRKVPVCIVWESKASSQEEAKKVFVKNRLSNSQRFNVYRYVDHDEELRNYDK